MIRNVLLLISISLEDGVEGIISDDLSETLESDGFDNIVDVGWGNLEGYCSNLINWDIDILRVLLESGIVWSLGGNKGL